MTFSGIRMLEQTPRVLRSVLTSASEDDLNWQPKADRWSISMVLAHLAEVEEKGFVSRFRALAEQDNAFLPAYDQMALVNSGRQFDGFTELSSFERERGETLAFLAGLPDSVRARTGRHESFGVLSFEELLNEFVFHYLGHVRQIIELYRSRVFYPKMGIFQTFYKINP